MRVKAGLLLLAATLLGAVKPEALWAQTTNSSAISQLAAYTAQGVTKQITGELTSWGMAQLGFPGTNGTAELESLLKEVAAELAAIQQDIADLDCIANASAAQNAAARIQGAWNTYQLAVEASYIDQTTLTDWENYVRGTGDNSLTADLQLVSNDFTGQGSGQSILASCETAADVQAPKKDTLDDRPAWKFSTNLIEYYADTEIVGVAMLADDFHLQAYQAWLAEGNTADDTTTDNLPIAVCGNPPANSSRAGACASATSYYTQYRQNVAAILNYGGAPYSTDQQLLLNGRGLLWVSNYNDFMMAGGYASSCVKETSAGTPCGAGVGEAALSKFYKLDSTSEEVSYGDYVTIWSPASADAWASLLKNWSSDHLVTYLSGLGFDRTSLENRFFYTGDTISGDFEVTKPYGNGNAHFHNLELACFVSPESPRSHNGFTILQPLCDKDVFLGLEHIGFNHSKKHNSCVTFQVDQYLINDSSTETETGALISNFEGGRYQMNQSCDDGEHVRGWEDPITNHSPGQPPGWLLSYRVNMTNTDDYGKYDSGAVTSPVNSQYRWPAVNLDDYYQQHDSSCTAESKNRSGTGVLPSLCGPLLEAYVNAYIPPAPNGAVPTLTVPEETLVVPVNQHEVPGGAHFQVQQLVDYAPQVSAFDGNGNLLAADCFPPSGKALGLGITRVRCSATNSDGDYIERTFNVHVQYPLFRFVTLIAGQDGMFSLKAGRGINIGFTMDGYKGLDVIAATPTSTRINCDTGELMGEPQPLRTTHRSWGRYEDALLSYNKFLDEYRLPWLQGEYNLPWKINASTPLSYNEFLDEYRFPWKTKATWRNQCRRLAVSLVDDTVHTVDGRFY